MQNLKESTWAEQIQQIQEVIDEKFQRRSLLVRVLTISIVVLIGSCLLTGVAVLRHRMKHVVRLNRNGLVMDLQGLRHLIRQSNHGKWETSDAKTLLAIRRSVLARISTLETADVRLSRVWTRLLNYLNFVMGAVGNDSQTNETLESFEQVLTRLEQALEHDHPSKVEMSMILKDLDQLTAA